MKPLCMAVTFSNLLRPAFSRTVCTCRCTLHVIRTSKACTLKHATRTFNTSSCCHFVIKEKKDVTISPFGEYSFKVKTYQEKYENIEPFHKRYIFLNTLTELYDDVAQGAVFDVCYLDSHPNERFDTKIPTVLALHGSPGSHFDFIKTLTPLIKIGYRVILPNFPGFHYTSGLHKVMDDFYTGATFEKVDFVIDFVNEIGIPQVDLLVGFGEGCYSVLDLMNFDPKYFKSIALLCPSGHKEYKGIGPIKNSSVTAELWNFYIFRPFLHLFWSQKKKSMGLGQFKTSHVIKAIMEAHRYEFQNYVGCLTTLKTNKVPFCIVFSENDERVEREISEEILHIVGVKSSVDKLPPISVNLPIKSVALSTAESSNVKSVSQIEYPFALRLKDGGHYFMENEENVNKVSLLLFDFINHTRNISSHDRH